MNYKVSYQVGVDVLGFPIYMQHEITTGQSTEKYNRKKRSWLTVIQQLFKQH